MIDFDYKGKTCIRVNDWKQTTGKHLNAINADKRVRINGKNFELALEAVLFECGLTV